MPPRTAARPLASLALLVAVACDSDPATAPARSLDAPRLAVAPGDVRITDLGLPPGETIDVAPRAINEAGHVVALTYSSRDGYIHRNGAWAVLAGFEGQPVDPLAINDAGDIAARGTSGGRGVALLRRGDVTTVLAPLAPGDLTAANDVNNAAIAVGSNGGVATGVYSAVIWRPGAPAEALPPLAGARFSSAQAINDAGQVVGVSNAGGERAVLWEGGSVRDLGTLGGSSSRATDVNERGEIVGSSVTAAGQSHAFLWRVGVMTDLGTVGGRFSGATGINDAAQVAGTSEDAFGRFRAFVWEGGVMTALEPLPGYTSSTAVAINNAGQILGHSHTPVDAGQPFGRATVWTVPVPGSPGNTPPALVNLRADPVTGPYSIAGRSCGGRYTACVRFRVSDADGAADAPFRTVVDWGDGTAWRPNSVPADTPLLAPHNYAVPGTYVVRVTAIDQRGASTAATLTLVVVP